VYTDAAIEFIEAHASEPFFVYLAFNAPHTPLQVPQTYYDRYAGLDSVPGRAALLAAGVREERLPSVDVIRRLYGMISNIDDNVGRLLAQLDESGIRENTLVIFLTDNGPQQYRYTAGLRALKGSVYEGGIRVPAFFHWPGTLAANREIDTYAAHIDVLPTLLSFAGLPLPDSLDIDGRDWSAALRGVEAPADERPLVFHWQRGYPEPYRNIAVRRGPYKLVGQTGQQAGPSELELYNLEDDPGERRDLSAEQPERVQELKNYFDEWLEEALSSPSVGDTRIVLGSDHENPVVLNRNDARGSPGMWRQDQIYGYWDVEVQRAGRYDFRIHYFEAPGQPGDALVRIGPVQRTVFNADTAATGVVIENVPLRRGKWMVESWYAGRDNPGGPAFTHFPFYIEVERVE
jgi:arylsulfatase